MYSKSFSTAIAATFIASANAHFFITKPAPIPGSAVKPPLDPSGSDWPCHGADLSSGPVTEMTVGSTQKLEFDLGGGANTAVHGGGSCQIALTYATDAAAQKDPANWKVIHTFLGGCPTNAKGNLVTAKACPDTDPECVNQNLGFEIPAEVQDGQAVLAWMWYNNIGNRETYMNCARVSISGGSGQLDSLPGMAIANIASLNSCKTTEQFNTDFANPGKYVTNDPTLNYPLKQMVGSGCDSGAGSGGNTPSAPSGGSGGGSTPSDGSDGSDGGSAPAAPVAPAPTTAPSVPQQPSGGDDGSYKPGNGSNPGGVFAPGAGESPAAPVPTTLATSAIAAPVSTAPAAAPASGDSGYIGSCTAGQVSCSAQGFYCIDSTSFGMCNWGCATPQQMSAGTACTANAVAHAVVPQRRRRSMRHFNHARAHMNLASPA